MTGIAPLALASVTYLPKVGRVVGNVGGALHVVVTKLDEKVVSGLHCRTRRGKELRVEAALVSPESA